MILTLTLDRVEVILVFICGRGLPTHQIRWKSEKDFLWTYGRTYGRTHLSSNLLGHRRGDDLKTEMLRRNGPMGCCWFGLRITLIWVWVIWVWLVTVQCLRDCDAVKKCDCNFSQNWSTECRHFMSHLSGMLSDNFLTRRCIANSIGLDVIRDRWRQCVRFLICYIFGRRPRERAWPKWPNDNNWQLILLEHPWSLEGWIAK